VKLAVQFPLPSIGHAHFFFGPINAFNKRPALRRTTGSSITSLPALASSLHTSAFCFFLVGNFLRVHSIREVLQIDEPYCPGSAICLDGDAFVSISLLFLCAISALLRGLVTEILNVGATISGNTGIGAYPYKGDCRC
jgi:hypothetical protein